jgi:methylamine---corrinoid protein Co-methyltransferase
LVLQLLPKYEYIFSQPGGNPGLPFDQVYDLETLQPLPEWLAMYQGVKDEVRQMGLVGLPLKT